MCHRLVYPPVISVASDREMSIPIYTSVELWHLLLTYRYFVTFCMRHSRSEMYIGHSCLCVSQSFAAFPLVIISITRYRDIDRGFVERTISWRPYIVRYRARTHVSRVRSSHTAVAASACDSCRLPCTPSVAPSVSRPAVDLSCSALGAWGGDWGTAVAPVVG